MNPGWRNNYLRYKSYFMNVMDRYREGSNLNIYTEIFLSLITISLFSIFALRPTLTTIAQLIKDVESKKNTLSSVNEKIEKISKAQLIYDQQKKNIELLYLAIPKTASPDAFVRQVEFLSASNQAIIDSIGTGKAVILGKESESPKSNNDIQKITDGMNSFSIYVSTQTDLSKFEPSINFISSLENLLTPLVIDNLSFSVVENKDSTKSIINSISGQVTYLKREEIK